jgi:hypothetical protein
LEEEEKRDRETEAQQATIERAMHEAKKGELKTSAGNTVKSRKQAVGIVLHEAGASNQETVGRTKQIFGKPNLANVRLRVEAVVWTRL